MERPGKRVELTTVTPIGVGGKDAAVAASINGDMNPIAVDASLML